MFNEGIERGCGTMYGWRGRVGFITPSHAIVRGHEQHLTTWDHADLNLDPDYIGLDGSPTIVSSVDPIPKPPAEREATMVDPTDERGMSEVFEEMQPLAAGGD